MTVFQLLAIQIKACIAVIFDAIVVDWYACISSVVKNFYCLIIQAKVI